MIYFYHSYAHTLTIYDTNSTDSFCILFLQIDGLNAGIFGWEITIHTYVHTYIRPFITMWQDSRMDSEWNFLSRSFFPPSKESVLFSIRVGYAFLVSFLYNGGGVCQINVFFLSVGMTEMSKSNRNFERDKFVTFKSHPSLEHIAERFSFSRWDEVSVSDIIF